MSVIERRLREFGFRAVAGTDEVGRGCLAGPVVAACVILDCEPLLGVNDSKMLDGVDRVAVCRRTSLPVPGPSACGCRAYAIDEINIPAREQAGDAEAVAAAGPADILLLDAVTIEALEMPQIPLIEGDKRSVSIAAASVVAKVYRDLLMESYHDRYPVYDFRHNRGYATESHQAALKVYGPVRFTGNL
jgi:ribonuclease HII